MIALLMDKTDNVAVVVQPVPAGAAVTVEGRQILAADAIPTGHKIAVLPIAAGEMVTKYGKVIGRASANIAAGSWVHCHNVEDITQQLCEEYARNYRAKGGACHADV